MGRAGVVASRALDLLMRLPTTTAEGRFFLVGLVAVGFLATATDRNYVLLVLGILLGVVIVSVVFSTWNLRGLSLHRTLPGAVIAGEAFTVRVRVENHRRWLPARGVLLRDALQSGLTGLASRGYAASIPAGGRVTFVYAARIRRRGIYNITNALLSTRFPFGLFEKRALARCPTRIVVYPRMREVAGERLPGSRDLYLALRERVVRRDGGEEFRALRDYRPGDDPRRIAWRVTARQGRLVLKEMEREERGRVAVVLSTSLAGLRPGDRRAALEQAVTRAASLVRHLLRERRPLLFAAPGFAAEGLAGREGRHRCLEHLATIRSDVRATADRTLREAGYRRLRGHDVILVCPGHAPEVPRETPGFRLHPLPSLSPESARLLRRSP